jgi:hypothetical protein
LDCATNSPFSIHCNAVLRRISRPTLRHFQLNQVLGSIFFPFFVVAPRHQLLTSEHDDEVLGLIRLIFEVIQNVGLSRLVTFLT